jgi:deoxyribodipyrimidine photo-lyase
MIKRAIVWFKNDLRLHDNETLVRAIEQSEEIIPVFCFDEAMLSQTQFGFRRIGKYRAQFLLESLADLDSSLREMGSGLVVLRGKPEETLPAIAREYNVQKVFARKEVAWEEKQQEEQVEKELWKLGCSLETFSTSTLYHAQDLPFTIRDIPDVFTKFRKQVEKEAGIRAAFPAPVHINSPQLPPLMLPTLTAMGLPTVMADNRRVIAFKGGEKEGMKRLDHYFFQTRSVATYKETRNGLIGENYSSKFSAWLAAGCISPRYIYEQLKKYESQYTPTKSTYWLVLELLWRDYFRFMFKKHKNKFFMKGGIRNISSGLGAHNAEMLQKWVNGHTGNDFIDANMLELKYTGFMSNRGRQNVASYFCNDLGLDWRYGAAYFEQQLIDYDVSSNWGNWAYIAGVGNNSREEHYFDVVQQATTFDPDYTYRNLWLQKI